MNKHCPDGASLLAYAEGRAAGESVQEIEEHVRGCRACAAEVDVLTRLSAALASAGACEVGGLGTTAGRALRGAGTCGEGYDPAAFLDGLLDRRARAQFELHVSECSTCLEELSDLMAARRHDAPVVRDEVVATTLMRLRGEQSHLLLQLAEDALTFVDGWIRAAKDFTVITADDEWEPVLGVARAERPPVAIHWKSDGGYSFDCELTHGVSGPEIVGRVFRDGAPAIEVSVGLRGVGQPRGPESVDADGRFGPWALGTGASKLRFEALHLPGGSVEITLDVARDATATGMDASVLP